MNRVLAARDELTREQGTRAIDAVISVWRCTRCRTPVSDPILRTMGQVEYRNLDGLRLWAEQVCAQLAGGDPPQCPDCGRTPRLQWMDYHAWHSGEQRDVVVRYTPGRLFRRARSQLMWWDALRGHRPLEGGLSREAARTFTRDAYLRGVEVLLQGDRLQEAVPVLQEAATLLAGDPAFLEHVPTLVAAGHHAVAQSLIQDHLREAPDDPQGHYWHGRFILEMVRRERWLDSRIPDAQAALERALELDPDHLGAARALQVLATAAPQEPGVAEAGEGAEAG